jgi:hypothetical protein
VPSANCSPEKDEDQQLSIEVEAQPEEQSKPITVQPIIEVEPSSILEFEMFEQQCIEEEN